MLRRRAAALTRRTGGARAGGFPGADTILAQFDAGTARLRVGLAGSTRAPVREGADVLATVHAMLEVLSPELRTADPDVVRWHQVLVADGALAADERFNANARRHANREALKAIIDGGVKAAESMGLGGGPFEGPARLAPRSGGAGRVADSPDAVPGLPHWRPERRKAFRSLAKGLLSTQSCCVGSRLPRSR